MNCIKKIHLSVFTVILLSIAFSCGKNEKNKIGKHNKPPKVQKPVVAGSFYPSDKRILANMVQGFIKKAGNYSPKERVLGMMVPHAGYVYSGPIAGYAYKYIQTNRYKTIIIIAPSHSVGMDGVSVLEKEYYETPLGTAPIDTELVKSLMSKAEWITYNPDLYKKEHSLEVHIPFIQMSTRGVKIVPIIMGNNSLLLAQKLAAILYEEIKERDDIFIVASSDMSHYLPYEEAKTKDYYTLDVIRTLKTQSLYDEAVKRKIELCGLGPVLTLMELVNNYKGKKVDVLAYANSQDTTVKMETVVGYGTVAFLTGEFFSEKEKRKLIQIARETVNEYVRNKKVPKVTVESPRLKIKGAAFVTLKKNGVLRGCIGHIVAQKPLYQTVLEMAIAAASKDPRFLPVTPDELDEIEIEVSVITPLTIVSNPEKIVVGEDGLLLVKGESKGVLLPQVPVEFGWTRQQFLRKTAKKAGLPPDGWEEGATLYTFQAIVFNERGTEHL